MAILSPRLREQLVVRHPRLCPELALWLLDDHAPLRLAIRQHGLWAVHEVFAGLSAPPHWAYAWAGGLAIARHLLDRPELVAGRSVLDVGTGCGIAAVAAARAGARRVLAVDRDSLAAAAAAGNATLNGAEVETATADVLGLHPAFDVVLAADVFYEGRELFERLAVWARSGCLVLASDVGRGGFDPTRAVLVARYAARTEPDIENREDPVQIYRLSGRPERGVGDQ